MRANRRTAAKWATLVATVLGFWAAAAAQPPADRVNPPANRPMGQTTDQEVAPPLAKQEGSAGSLRLRTDRPATERLEAARTQLRQGHAVEALQLLDRLPHEGFLVLDDRIVTVPWAVEQLLEHLPARQRADFNAAATPAATQAWQRFLVSQAWSDLLAFCRDYGQTEAGLAGWQTAAGRYRDEARWTLAAAAWKRVEQHAHARDRDREWAIIGQLESQFRLGDANALRALFTRHRDRLQKSTLTIAGRETLAADFVAPWLQETSNSELSQPGPLRPALTPRWTVPLQPPNNLGPHLEQWFSELRDHGVWLLPSARPLLTDRLVLVRSPQALLAVDSATGRPEWQIPFDDWPWIDANPGILDNPGYRTALLEQLGRRLLADTVLSQLTADRERVYLAQESRQTQGNPANFGAPAVRNGDGPMNPGERFNHLAAYRLDNGELVWRIGGVSAGPSYPLGGEYFCGPPTVIDDVLFVCGQQQTELQLLAIESRRGELLWKTTLGDLPRQLASDPARQRIACPVVWQDGVLLCPTAAGALVAVDPLTQTPRWAYRYGVSLRESAYRQRNENTAYLPDLWWDAWRETTLKCAGDIAVLASPESDWLHAVQVRTGQVQWSVPRGNALCLLDLADGAALVLEPTALRAHDLSTGRLRWRTPVGESAGRAVVTNTHLVLPTSDGGVIRLRLDDGRREDGAGAAEEPIGNLAMHQGDWYSVSTASLAAWPDLNEALPLAEQVLQSDPDDAAARRQAARYALQAGQAGRAWELLRADRALAAESLKRQSVSEILAREPDRWTEFRETWEALSPVERVERALELSAAAIRVGDRPAAAELLLNAVNEAPVAGAIPFENPRRLVRPDLSLVGAFVALLQQSSETERRAIEQRLAERWTKAASGTDPFAIQQLTERLAAVTSIQRRLGESSDAAFLGLPLLAVELRLLEAAGSADETLRSQALRELIAQLTRNGFPREADDYRRAMLRGDYGPVAQAAAAALPAPSSAWEREWPHVVPQADSQRERNEDVYQFPVPMDHDSGPLFDRLDVLVDRQGRSVRFSGGGVSGVWTVALPASQSSFRYLQHHTLGWGRGGLLILRVGFELFALAPFNDRGEPQAKVLWTLNTAGESGPSPDRLRLDVVPAVPGVREDEYRVVDFYGRSVGQVGPVRAGFLCYAEKSKLVSIDTLTGQRRWVRYDLPAGFVLGGDDDVIFVWQPQTGRIDWLQASDGRTIASQAWPISPDELILQSGRMFWHRAAGQPTRLVCEDPLEGRIVWSRDLLADETPFALSAHTLGAVRPNGTLQLLSAQTGAPQSPPLNLPGTAGIDRVVASRDDQRWYVAVSERVPQQAGLQQAQLRSGFRSPFINGPLAAIDRDGGQLLWQTGLEREPWPADQPRAVPLLMQVYKLPSPDLQAGRQSDGVVQLRDKRNGQVVFRRQGSDLVGYATLAADPDRAVVDLQLERETVRLRYRPLPPPPAPPDP